MNNKKNLTSRSLNKQYKREKRVKQLGLKLRSNILKRKKIKKTNG